MKLMGMKVVGMKAVGMKAVGMEVVGMEVVGMEVVSMKVVDMDVVDMKVVDWELMDMTGKGRLPWQLAIETSSSLPHLCTILVTVQHCPVQPAGVVTMAGILASFTG